MQPRNPADRKNQNTRDAPRRVVLGGFSSKRGRQLDPRFEENTTADNAAPGPLPAEATGDPHAPRRPGAEALLTLISGVLAGITGVYVATHSVLITVIAAAMALMVAAMVLIFWR